MSIKTVNTASAGLRQLESLLKTNLLAAMEMATGKARDDAKQNHRYQDRTGTLTKNTAIIPPKAKGGVISGGLQNTSKVALYIHEGTGTFGPNKQPYVILPRNGKALSFEIPGSGAKVFAKKVIHPGIKPDPFLSKAVHSNKAFFKKAINGAIKKAIKQAGKR